MRENCFFDKPIMFITRGGDALFKGERMEKDNMGCLHVICGSGKGKTSAAVGMAVRALGAGLRVMFVQFLKDGTSSEVSALSRLGAEIRAVSGRYGFTWELSASERQELCTEHNALLSQALSFMEGGGMLVLDELSAAYNEDLADRALVEMVIAKRRDCRCEVVVTGREPARLFLDGADYISEIACVRHPYERGQNARRGIEF